MCDLILPVEMVIKADLICVIGKRHRKWGFKACLYIISKRIASRDFYAAIGRVGAISVRIALVHLAGDSDSYDEGDGSSKCEIR